MPIELQPTAYAEANTLLNQFLNRVRDVLADEFFGLYLHGSLALGDFDPASSDIDFFVVTHHALSAETFDSLASMHTELEATGLAWISKLEGSYIPLDAIHRYDPTNHRHPRYDYGTKMHLCGHGSDTYIQYWALREKGISLAGPAPLSFMEPVTADELRQASVGILQEWWLPQMADTSRLQKPGYESYAILTMCRILYTLEHGAIASKPAAGRWVQAQYPQWATHIERALAERGEICLNTVEQTVQFIRFVDAQSAVD